MCDRLSPIISDFSTDLDGWTLADHDPSSTLTYVATGGESGGYIQFSDAAQGSNDVFSAPAKFLGNDSAFSHGTLSFALAHNQTADDISTSPLVITAVSGDTLALILTAPATSNSPFAWTDYSLGLNPSTGFVFDGGTNSSAGFNLSGGSAATQAQIDAVLGNVASIFIPADMHTGIELTGLDNVMLTSAIPEPANWGLLAGAVTAMLVMFPRRLT